MTLESIIDVIGIRGVEYFLALTTRHPLLAIILQPHWGGADKSLGFSVGYPGGSRLQSGKKVGNPF